MSALVNPYHKYRQNQAETASPGELIVMLYDGAIRFLKVAEGAVQEKKIEMAHQHIVKVQDIIDELNGSLNMDSGSEISENLRSLYQWISEQLLQANLKKDAQILQDVRGLLMELREAWVEINKKGAAASG